MQYWQVKVNPFKTRTYIDARKKTLLLISLIHLNPKRKFFVKSAYFNKQKIFFDHFWVHLLQKPIAQRKQRLKLFPCAIELLENSNFEPSIKEISDGKERLLRFCGSTQFDQKFVVQLKQTKGKTLQCISIFPSK